MTLWVTLLLVWTAGIPAVLFLTACLAARLGQRRAERLPAFPMREGLRVASPAGCGRRVRSHRTIRSEALRPRVGFRRRV
ncbi:MAG TPA: hypothetical protein VJU60_07925 [Thermoleophilaceae bacterium]|nr:hypothetical protein [Thermoleophilaceae bacterium]